MQPVTSLGKGAIRDHAAEFVGAVHTGEEGVEHGLLGLIAHRQQRADECRQRQFAAAREGVWEVGMSRALSKLLRGDSLGELQYQRLYEFTGIFPPYSATLSRVVSLSISNKSTAYGRDSKRSGLSSVDCCTTRAAPND